MRNSIPFKNLQATKSFFAVVTLSDNPLEISRAIGVKRNTVYDHLKPLREKGIIRLKDSMFSINWTKFNQEFKKNWINLNYEWADKKSKKDACEIADKIFDRYPDLVSCYISSIAFRIRTDIKDIKFTLMDCVEDFFTAMPHLVYVYEGRKDLNREKKKLISLFRKANEIFLRMDAVVSVEAIEYSFSKVGKPYPVKLTTKRKPAKNDAWTKKGQMDNL